jgi:hypothetical protein
MLVGVSASVCRAHTPWAIRENLAGWWENRARRLLARVPNLRLCHLPPIYPPRVRVAQAANVEVYVTQMPRQDAVECHARNIHHRSFADISAAVDALEPPPAATVLLECTCFTDTPAPDPDSVVPPHSPAVEPRRLRRFFEAASLPRGSCEGGLGVKRAKTEESEGGRGRVSDRELLESVDKGLAAAEGVAVEDMAKSRWEEDSEEEQEEERGGAARVGGRAAAPGTATAGTASYPHSSMLVSHISQHSLSSSYMLCHQSSTRCRHCARRNVPQSTSILRSLLCHNSSD